MADQKNHPAVGIAAVISGIALCIVVVIAIFARDQLLVAAWIVTPLSIMGFGLGFVASRDSKSPE